MSTQPWRLAHGGLIDRSRPLRFRFNGRELTGYAGDTLASALLANGVHLVGRSFKYHRPRGILGAGAEEPNALVQLETGARTEPNTRATQVELYDGLEASSQNCWPSVGFDIGAVNDLASRLLPAGFYYKTFMWPPSAWMTYERYIRKAAGMGRAPSEADPDHYEHRYAHCDVLVAGGGPAGLSAALAAARAGARVILADESLQPGGSLLHEDVRIDGAPARQWVEKTLATLRSCPEVTVLARSTVFGYFDHNFLAIAETVSPRLPNQPRQRIWKVHAKRVVLATGAIERPLVFADNDRPGIMLASAVRRFLKCFAVRAGRRSVVFTNNDSAYLTALDLAEAGVTVAAIVDAREEPGREAYMRAREVGIPVLCGHVVTRATGTSHIRGCEVAPFRERRAAGAGTRIECDLLCVSGGWSPAVHLFSQSKGRLRYDESLAAFVPGESVQAEQSAGAARGVYSAGECVADGHAAGSRAAEACGFAPVPAPPVNVADEMPVGSVLPLWRVESADVGHRKAFVDFQNDVTAADVALAAREGYLSVEHLKRYTTLGMGTDQGKTSGINGLALLAEIRDAQIAEVGTTTFRPPYCPVTFGALAGCEVGPHFDPVRLSPMHGWHEKAGARFVNAGLWRRPQFYPRPGESDAAAINREVLTVRRQVGLVDVSTLGKIDIKGRDAAEFLERVYVNRWKNLAVGKARYGLMLREDGMVFDDGTTTRLGASHFLMTTTTANAARVMSMLEYWLQVHWRDLDVRLTSVTDQWAAMALAGPEARSVLSRLTAADVGNDALPWMGYRALELAGVPARIFRISFSGELAYEINVPADYGPAVWEAILAAGRGHGITAYGTEAMAVLRIEKGHVAGMELDGRTTPSDLGLERMVAADKDCIGKRSLSRPALTSTDRKQLVGLVSTDTRSPIPRGAQIVADPGQKPPVPILGHVTSTCYSPTLGRPIALALVRSGRRRHGERLYAVSPLTDERVQVEITQPVFYDREGVRVRG